jgi:hypothetical protein
MGIGRAAARITDAGRDYATGAAKGLGRVADEDGWSGAAVALGSERRWSVRLTASWLMAGRLAGWGKSRPARRCAVLVLAPGLAAVRRCVSCVRPYMCSAARLAAAACAAWRCTGAQVGDSFSERGQPDHQPEIWLAPCRTATHRTASSSCP